MTSPSDSSTAKKPGSGAHSSLAKCSIRSFLQLFHRSKITFLLITKKKKAAHEVLNAGCEILYERVAEAYDPAWRDLLRRIFQRMKKEEKINA
jgi:hypothetical protein